MHPVINLLANVMLPKAAPAAAAAFQSLMSMPEARSNRYPGEEVTTYPCCAPCEQKRIHPGHRTRSRTQPGYGGRLDWEGLMDILVKNIYGRRKEPTTLLLIWRWFYLTHRLEKQRNRRYGRGNQKRSRRCQKLTAWRRCALESALLSPIARLHTSAVTTMETPKLLNSSNRRT
jgi:hypothetical protein